MDDFLSEKLDNSLSYGVVEQELDTFLKGLNFKEYRVHKSLYYFEENIFSNIIFALNNCKLPYSFNSYKDVLCEKIFLYLGFGNNDMVLYVEDAIYAKSFLQVTLGANESERRACGISQKLLEEQKQMYFKNNEHKDKILFFLPHVVERNLNFKKLNPFHFKKLFIPAFVSMIETVVLAYTDLEDEADIRGFSLYLLREMFDELMLFVAEDILFHFSNSERKAIDFLSFFSIHDSLDSHGKRHKANPILDESNHAWNITTIRSTMMQHKNAKQAVYEKKNALISIKNKLDMYKLEQKEIDEQKVRAEEVLEECLNTIDTVRMSLSKLQETDAVEVRFKEDGEEKVIHRTTLMARLFKKEDKLLTQRNKIQKTLEEIAQRVSNKQKDIDLWEKKYTENNEFLANVENNNPIDKQYERIVRALARTLASK